MRETRTVIECYDGDARHPFAHVYSPAVPRVGDLINIKKVTWRVRTVTWAIDTPPEQWRAIVRCA